ncbi:Crp/Fnr family transcriptional regulator [Proteiniclasticum sp. C24MP]|uniref:Crp/Fnr family transcriptional regulator n=1 Tax=Proteiniclasticum sp. C24MP TaxID=3374101 RepID=UPI003754B145
MEINMTNLMKNSMFNNMSEEEIRTILDLSSCTQETYEKDSLVIEENEDCDTIGFVLEGILTIQQYGLSGDALTINVFRHGDCFGAPLLFTSKAKYPFTLVTSTKSTVLFIPFAQMRTMLEKSQTFNTNYLTFLSNHIFILKNKIKILAHNDVRSRLMIYLSREIETAGSTTFRMRHKKIQISEIIKVARPSVSRELSNMERDGLIRIEGNEIEILAPEEFVL